MALVTHELIFELIGRYGYALVFVLGVCEALPLVGIVVPGHATLILAGVASAAGLLDVKWVIVAALAAGILGDAIGFWISRRYGRAFLDKYGARLRIRPEHVAKSNAIFEKHGPWALVLVRFSFVARGVGPMLAGLSEMRWRTFWLYNVVGAVLWSVGNALGGYAFGVAFIAAEGLVGRILAYTALGVAGIYVLYRVLRRFAPAFARGDFVIAMVGVATAALFGVLAEHVSDVGLDNPLDRHAGDITRLFAPAAGLARAVDLATGLGVAAVLALVAIALLLARRRVWQAVLVALGVGGVIVLVEAIQPAFNVVPQGAGAAQFPSAHAAVSLVLVGVATSLVWAHTTSPGRSLAVAAAGFVLVAAASSARMAQGTEYPTSVLAGLLLGAAWYAVSLLLVEYGVKRPRHAATETS
jgi:undecaprenyl-diphosphatase